MKIIITLQDVSEEQADAVMNEIKDKMLPDYSDVIKDFKIENGQREESLTTGLVNALLKFCKAVAKKNENKIHLQKECDLTKNEYNNFQKLRYFGLVKQVTEPGKQQSGFWALTIKGAKFLKGEVSVPKTVIVSEGHTVQNLDPLVYVTDINGVYPYWLKYEDYTYRLTKRI